MSKHGFTVEEDSSDTAAQKAITELRRMARYGRQAERALASIRETGFFAGRAPMAGPPEHDHGDRHGREKMTVRVRTLPKRLPVSRADLGDMSLLRVSLGRIKKANYSAHDCHEADLFVEGPMATQLESGVAEYSVGEERRAVGSVRINKGHLSWLEPDYHKGAWRIYKDAKYAGAQESLAAFAKHLSKALCVAPRDEDGVHALPAAKTLDLQATAWEWILADGHAERLFQEVHRAVTVAQVMES